MNYIAEHVEYLLRSHDCVVIPGFGAFLCNYEPAHFDERCADCLVPPGRSLAFNNMISDSDGLLVCSVARKEGVSVDDAAVKVRDMVDAIWNELEAYGESAMGRLGTFYKHKNGEIEFDANYLPSVNGPIFGLQAVELTPVSERRRTVNAVVQTVDPVTDNAAVSDAGGRILRAPADWRAYATGIVASLAVVITVALFLISPIRLNREVHEAALAPLPSSERQLTAAEEYFEFDYNAVVAASACGIVCKEMATTDESQEIERPLGEEYHGDAVKTEGENKPELSVPRFNEGDPYYVIVASFPSKSQAQIYLNEHRGMKLGILEKDSKYRVYAATGATYSAAENERRQVDVTDAWICRR
ncbi:MAG: SPOR domain-containing protein [Muribaculaceae bacterium]|nr:SPOR domain-containing protein [Muribaculaceae bacterium]